MRVAMICLNLFMFFGFAVAGEVTVERVVTFGNTSKTSVVIYYAGSDRLQFFALDSDEGVFTLDLPGAISKFDFSSLEFEQVRAVQQVPLDPDLSTGISVRFFLKKDVTYHVFEGGAGELTLFFESPSTSGSTEVAETAPAPQPQAREWEELASNPVFTLGKKLEGAAGENRFSAIQVLANETAGTLFLTVDGDPVHKYFFLENPKRYVLDLHEVVLSLDENRLPLDLPLVKQVRMRQFQSHPTPITRIVLDLATEANVTAVARPGGFQVAFGSDAAGVQNMLALASPDMAVESEPAQRQPEVVADAAVQPPPDDVKGKPETGPLQSQHMETQDAATPPAIQETAVVKEDAPPLVDEVVSDTVADAPAPLEDGGDTVTVRDPESHAVAAAEEDRTTLPTSESQGSEPVPFEDEGGQAEKVAEADPEADLPAEPIATSSQTAVAATEVQNQNATPAPVPETEGPQNADTDEGFVDFADLDLTPVENPKFVPANGVDLEMEAFLNEGDDSTIYGMMKGMKSNRKDTSGIVVTNSLVERSKQLGETRSMQEESSPEDFAALFRDETSEDPYETIGGGEPEYRGFEISIIDVKDANVVDLLRFLADQVGFNLYVDSSVKDVKATYRFRNIPWDQALDIILSNANLDKEFRNGVLRVATTKKFQDEEKARADLREQRELSVPVETVTFPLNYAKAADVVPIVSEYLSPRGTILMDERTNTLIIEDIPKKMVAIRALIKKLDKMVSQVTIEARVVETSKRFLKELGIQWGLTAEYSPELGTDTGLDFPNRATVGGPTIGLPRIPGSNPEGGYAVNFPVVAENPSGIGLTLGNFLDNFKLDISLQMLESEGFGQIISSPKITTQNNKTATIQNGQRIPIQTIQRGTVTIRYLDAVLELQVTPHITSDETIIMDLVVNKSEPDFTRTVGGNPVINVRKAETKVLVKNGGTAVIGGIYTLNESTQSSGIPKLRTVPFLRRIFGSELQTYENQELLIFVTPRIVKY